MKLLPLLISTCLIYLCQALPNGYHTIKSYEVQESDEMGLSDCDIVSGSVTIVNCPQTMNFTVYLSANIYNQTLNESYNEVQGEDDILQDRFDEKDFIRNITMNNVNVTSVRQSNERATTLNKNSIIVIMVNDTESDVSNYKWTHSVWRYFQSPTHGWIESEYLFSTNAESRVFYEQVDLFDDWAIGYKEDIFSVIFYKGYLGELVPSNYEVFAYNQEYETKNSDIIGYTFFDLSGVSGEWELIILIRFNAAIQLVPVTMVISPTSYNVRFSQESSQTYLTTNIEVSSLMSPSQLVLLACETCNSDKGTIYFYDAKTLKLVHTLEGEDNNQKKVGKFIEYRPNTGYSEQYWFTSQAGSTMTLNTILFFKQKQSTEWEFEVTEDLLSFEGTDVVLEPIKDHFVYKEDSSTDLKTFVACDYNYIYNTPDETEYTAPIETDEDCVVTGNEDCVPKDDRVHFLAYRNCTKCPDDKPFSYGFQDDECHACDEFAEQFLVNADAYVNFIFSEACEGARKPVSCEELDICEDYPEEEDFFSGDNTVKLAGSGAAWQMFNLATMIIALTFTVAV